MNFKNFDINRIIQIAGTLIPVIMTALVLIGGIVGITSSSKSDGSSIDGYEGSSISDMIPEIEIPGLNGNSGSDADQDQEIVLNQGDQIFYSEGYNCTLAYIDVLNKVAYTAAHCGLGTDNVIRNSRGQIIGKATPDPSYIDGKHNQEPEIDIATISLNDNVIGSNIYSGDTITDLADVNVGDEICTYGKTTNEVLCGNVVALPSWQNLIVSNLQTSRGDSGGPVWMKNSDGTTSFVAVHRGSEYGFKNGMITKEARHTALKNSL